MNWSNGISDFFKHFFECHKIIPNIKTMILISWPKDKLKNNNPICSSGSRVNSIINLKIE